MPDAYEQKMRQLEQLRAVLAQQEQQIRTLQQQPDLGLSVDPQVATSAQIAPQGLIAPAQGTEMFPAASTGIGSLAPIPPLREQIETYFQPPGDFLGNLAVDVPRTALEQVAFAEDIAHDPLGAGKEMAQGVAEAVRMLGAFQGIPEPTFQKERREQLGGREITRKSILEQMYDRPVGTTLQMLMPVLFSIGGAKLAGKAKIVKRLMDKGKPFKDATTIGMKAAGIKSPESAIAKWDAEITRQFEQQPTEVAAEAIGEAIQPKASQLRKQQRTLEVPQTSVSKTGFEAVYRGEGRASQKGGGHWSTDKEFARQFTQMGKESEVISSYIKRKDIYEFADPPYAGDAAAFDIAVAEAKAAGFKAVRLSEGLNQPTSLYVFDRSALKSTRVPELPKPKEAPDALQRQEAQAPAKAQAGEVKKLGYIDNLIEQYNAAGHVASRYRRSKQIDVDGRTMSNKDAIVKMRRVVTEQPKAKAQEVALPKIAEETGWMYKGVNKSGKHVFAHKKTGGTLVMDNIRGVRERLIKTGDKFTESVKNPVIIPKEFYKRKWSEVEAQWRQGKFGDVSPYEAQRLHKIAVKEAIAEGKIKSHPDYPELGKPAKQPYEMTRGEFEADFFFHGKGEGHPTFGKRDITGGVTKKISEASGYAGRGKGEIHLIRKRDLAPGARQEMADILREQRALGNKKAKADHAVGQGFQPEGSIQSEIVIPGSVKYPHEYLIKQAIRENKPVPAEVLAEYPELVAKPTPKVEKGAVEPVTAKPTPEPPKAIGLKKTEIESIRKNTGLDQLDAAERRGWEEVLHKAKNEKVDQTILESADEIIRSGRQISDVEHAGMVVKAARLADEYDASIKTVNQLVEKGDVAAVKLENARAESMIAQMDKLTEASDVGGREAARALSIRRMMVNRETYDLAHIVQRAQAAKGRKLTTAERGKFEQMTSEHGRLQKQLKEVEANYDKLVVEREIANAEKVAATEVKKAKIESRKKVLREKIQIERGEIKKQLTEMGFRVNDITGVTAEGSYLVGKLAVNYIKDGAVSLDAVVQKVLADLPQLTKRDVYQSLITKDPKVQAKARAETFKRVGQLKTQARLLLEIEKVEKGVFEPTTATQRATQPVAIRQLQKKLRELRATAYKSNMSAARLEKAVKTINELQDQLANQYRSVKKGKPELTPDLAVAREKIKDLRKTMHVADELTKTQEQLRTGNFDIKVKPVEKPILPELERAQIQLKVNRKRIRTAIKDMEPMTAGKVGVEAINTARTLKATADMSAVMRQGLVLSVRRPIVAGKAFGKSFKAFFDKYTAEQIDNAIKSAPHHYIREKSGLQLMEVGGRVARGEEMFMSSVAEKIPLYGRVVKASERHMVSYLNMIRTAAFDQLLQKFPNATHAELTAWADFVNKASGRGNLGKFAGAANTLSLGFFAPRFAVSRIQTPLALFGKSSKGVTRRVRKEIAKDLVATASLGATALTLAHLAGAEVGTDPRSADWGKIKVGNTRIDIWGGMQQPMRVVARSGLGITDKLGLTGEDLTDWQKDVDPVELAARFSQYKFSPLITIPLELYKGKTIVGEDVTPSETAAKAAIPMVYEDMVDAWRLEGVGQSAWVGGLAFFGVGASTYSRKEGRENTIRKLLEEAAKATSRDARKSKESAAKSLQTKWNKLHPKDRINIL